MRTKTIDLTLLPDLDSQTGLLLAVLENVTKEWRGELEEVSEAELLWQPFPGGHSIGALILHMADVEAYWIHEIGAGQTRSEEELKRLLSEETQQYQVQWPTPEARPLSWFYAQQDEIRVRTKEWVRQIGSLEATGRRVREGEEQSFTLRWLLSHVIAHEAYHGGQAVLLWLQQRNAA